MPALSYMIIEQYVQVFGDQLFSWATSVLKHQCLIFRLTKVTMSNGQCWLMKLE